MLLENKNAVIYGGGGAIGGAATQGFAREGARVFLAGRTRPKLEAVAERIRAAGGTAETAEVDALDEAAVDQHADAVAREAGSFDISFNLISHGNVFGQLLAEMSYDDFSGPVSIAVKTQFLTGKAAARHMTAQGSGVILMFGGSGGTVPRIGATQIAFDAVEGLRRQWAVELAEHGVRVVTIRTGGVPESIPADFEARDQIVAGIEGQTMLGRPATLADVDNVAAFVASDQARTLTSTAVNISCGAVVE